MHFIYLSWPELQEHNPLELNQLEEVVCICVQLMPVNVHGLQ